MGNKSVALFLSGDTNPYIQQIRREAEAEAAHHGIRVDTVFADNCFLQIRQLYARIRAGDADAPSAVIVYPTHDEGLERVAFTALERDIDWVSLHRPVGDVEQMRVRFPQRATTLVTPDHVEIGRQQAHIVLSLHSHERVLYVQGSTANASARQRLKGFEEVMGAGCEIVGIVDGNWTAEDAQLAVERWLRVMFPSVPGIDAVVAQSDLMAMGAKAAFRAAGVRGGQWDVARIPIVGCDGLADVGCQLVDTGAFVGTVVIQGVGAQALRVAAKHLHTGELPPATIVVPVVPYAASLEAELPPLSRAVQTPVRRLQL